MCGPYYNRSLGGSNIGLFLINFFADETINHNTHSQSVSGEQVPNAYSSVNQLILLIVVSWDVEAAMAVIVGCYCYAWICSAPTWNLLKLRILYTFN